MRGWVVLCDLHASKSVEEPDALRASQDALLERLNHTYANDLLLPWERLKGIDEFGCVAKTGSWRSMLADTWMGLHPHAIRAAVAHGPVSDTGGRNSMRDAHGDAIHKAAELMLASHQEGSLLRVDGSHPWEDRRTGDLGHLLNATMLSWTPRQVDYYRAYHPGRTQAEAARVVGVKQPTVAAALSRMNGRYFRDILHRWTTEEDRSD